ncbi:MAG: polysaccharide biosynthesis/export family protein [Saprospiraceae bacterium]|nr:polysaccharide biosynthesis/export family protein [Saprospiraceae bacterium]
MLPSRLPELITNIPELRIQKKDILAISVQTTLGLNPEDVAPFNLQGGNIPGNSLNYQVDGNGNIEFPMVGQVHLEGLTLYEAKDTLTQLLTRDFKAPVVNIRFTSLNLRYWAKYQPGTYTLPDDRVSILDA